MTICSDLYKFLAITYVCPDYRVLASRVSFWHPGPLKIPILGGKDTLSFGKNLKEI